jgi:photosystem II stability/assembly factor-like uncharacterized protein
MKNLLVLFSCLLMAIVVFVGNEMYKEKIRVDYEYFLISEYSREAASVNLLKGTVSFDRPDMATYQDFYVTRDPVENRVPHERLVDAYEMVKDDNVPHLKSSELVWQEIPSNMGGRTRALMFDPGEAYEGKKVWAGAVTGGLWVNNDFTSTDSSWYPVGDFWEKLSISCIVADPNNNNVFYVGTGEAQTAVTIYRESSTKGAGIYKSSDGGATWSLLESTQTFPYITDIVLRVENDTTVIYAGVVSGDYKGKIHLASPSDGLYRSNDGGLTWAQVLPDIPGEGVPYSPADVELTFNNRIYVGTHPNTNIKGGGTILWSDNGADWSIHEEFKSLIENSGDPLLEIPGRVVLASTPAAPNSIYGVVAAGGYTPDNFIFYKGRYIVRSEDNGASWDTLASPVPKGGWSTLAWHALTINVSPDNADEIFVGGLDLHKSMDGGNTWHDLSLWWNYGPYYNPNNLPYVHADQHLVVFQPGSSDTALFCSDGGIFRTFNAEDTDIEFTQLNKRYNSLQFYTCAINPKAGNTHYVSGSQDNGTLVYYGTPLNVNADMVSGGDGAFCFYDENDPEFLITSVYNNGFYVNELFNGRYGLSHGIFEYYDSTGLFINPMDYNSETNTLYANAATFSNRFADKLVRISNITDLYNYDTKLINANTGSAVPFSAVKALPGNELFLGTQSGRLFKVSDAHETLISTEIGDIRFPTANISCVEVGSSNDQVLVIFSNYGVSSVWYTDNGGTNWKEVEGNLPDIPVRWAVFNPANQHEVYLATELGIWTTTNIKAEEVSWQQVPSPFPNVRTDMLKVRKSDNTMLVASHGRGMFVTVLPGTISGEDVINENGSLQCEVFPTKVTDVVNIKFLFSQDKKARVQVYNVSGQLIFNALHSISKEELIQVDVSDWQSGTYMVSVIVENKRVTKKIYK